MYTTALARGRFDGKALVDVKEIFIAEPWADLSGGDASRIVFAPDGTLFMSSSHHRDEKGPQDPNQDIGKILRLNDDGSNSQGQSICGQARDTVPRFIPSDTAPCWAWHSSDDRRAVGNRERASGGDEVNVIQPGKNYGWPLVTYGHDYDGTPLNERSRAAKHGFAEGVLGAVDHDVWAGVLLRRPDPGMEREISSWAP